MDGSASFYIIIIGVILILFCLSAFFALCETAFSSLNRIKLKNIAEKDRRKRKSAGARLALKLLDSYDKLLSSVLIGNTIVNVVTSALATVLFIGLFGAKGVTIASVVVTVMVLIFGEISPKTLAKESPELTAIRAAPLLHFFTTVFAPFNYLASAWKNIIIKIFPVKTDRSVTEDELLTFVGEVRQEGGINKHEEHMIRQVIEFDDITVSEIVTPRIDLVAVSETCTVQDIDRMYAETGFSRLPVFRDNIDNIIGVILLKDFYLKLTKNDIASNTNAFPLEIIKPVVFITKTMKISKLLVTLQKKQSHMAVIVDEFGGTLGIVTVEDIIEELVGEIWDEHDSVVEQIKKNNDGSFTVLGSVQLQDMVQVIKTTAVDLPAGDEIPGTTIGNWIMETKGGPARPGEHFNWHNLCIRVLRVQRHRVMEVIVEVRNQPCSAIDQ